MKKNLIFSLRNNSIKKNKYNILAGNWVFEKFSENEKKKVNEVFLDNDSFNKKKRILVSLKVNKIFNNIMPDLLNELNKIHEINLDLRSWKIIIGHWLVRAIQLIYQKADLINKILKKKEISKVYGIKSHKLLMCGENSSSIWPQTRDNLWVNNIIYKYFDYSNFKNLIINFETVSKYQNNYLNNYENKNKETKPKLKEIIFNYFNFRSKKNVIESSSMPFFYNFFFNLLFFQIPNFFKNNKIDKNNFILNKNLRSKLKISKKGKSIENFIREIIPEIIPFNYLENFKNLYDNCEIGLPINPKFIISSFLHDHDDKSKIYTAKHISKGTKFYVIQHGKGYFDEDYNIDRIDIQTSDLFFSWGYSNKKKIIPIGNVKTLNNRIRYNKKGNLNLVISPVLAHFTPYDRNIEYLSQLDLVKTFYSKISDNLKNNIRVRLHPTYNTPYGKWVKKNYFNKFNNRQLDDGTESYKGFLSSGRLNIIFYDGTGIVENLHFNVPTIAIWVTNPKHFTIHIDDAFVKKYKILKKANIFFDNLYKLIDHVERYWDNIDDWWLTNKTQDSIKEFNKDYNEKTNIFSLLKIKKIIKKNLSTY